MNIRNFFQHHIMFQFYFFFWYLLSFGSHCISFHCRLYFQHICNSLLQWTCLFASNKIELTTPCKLWFNINIIIVSIGIFTSIKSLFFSMVFNSSLYFVVSSLKVPARSCSNYCITNKSPTPNPQLTTVFYWKHRLPFCFLFMIIFVSC